MLVAMAGPVDSWNTNPYLMHKRLFERTGDPLELERMLRHVKPDSETAR